MTIGLCAPSFGCASEPYRTRYLVAKRRWMKRGFQLKESASVLVLDKGRSADAKTRAKEWEALWFDDTVDAIISVAGGEWMMEMLPYLDWERIRHAKPKLFMGYSDNTNITFLLTTLCDVASIYGYHLGEFSAVRWGASLQETFAILSGESDTVISKPKYESLANRAKSRGPLASFQAKTPSVWKSLQGADEVTMSGRLIGGCLDVLVMLCGTRYDQVDAFIDRYQEDGLIWYLESCDLNVFAQGRAYWQLKEAGWFRNCKGILIGRPLSLETGFGVTYEDMLHDFLDDLQVPVLYDVDLGHLPPSCPIINGSYGKVTFKEATGSIRMEKR